MPTVIPFSYILIQIMHYQGEAIGELRYQDGNRQ